MERKRMMTTKGKAVWEAAVAGTAASMRKTCIPNLVAAMDVKTRTSTTGEEIMAETAATVEGRTLIRVPGTMVARVRVIIHVGDLAACAVRETGEARIPEPLTRVVWAARVMAGFPEVIVAAHTTVRAG
jgi:hypothetical protein